MGQVAEDPMMEGGPGPVILKLMGGGGGGGEVGGL